MIPAPRNRQLPRRSTPRRLELWLLGIALAAAPMRATSAQAPAKPAPAPQKVAVPRQVVINQAIGVNLGAVGRQADDRGDAPPLVLPESEDLNRVLRKVTEFFSQDPPKWDEGAKMMQDLLEGKVFDDEVADEQMLDPFYSVYSADQRLFVPFARYCQQLLCQLPPEGLEAYRFLTDGRARAALETARATLDVAELQRLGELFFASGSGPEIVSLLADLAELGGQMTRAIFLRQRLLESFPDLGDELRIQLLVRQAHASALLGDEDRRASALDELTMRGRERRVDVAGDKIRVADLAEHPAFVLRRRSVPTRVESVGQSAGLSSLSLTPLWRFEFAEPDPYFLRQTSKNRNNNMVFFGSMQAQSLPNSKQDRPGSTVLTWQDGDSLRVAVKDHDALRVLGALSGKSEASDTGKSKPSKLQNQMLRVRIPLTDVLLQSITSDGRFLYCTDINKTPSNNTRSQSFPYTNELRAFDLETGKRAWVAKSESAGTKNRVFFQGPPVRYREWLYAPVRRQRSFCIARLDAASGAIDRVVNVHAGGSRLLRVPAVSPIVVDNQLIYMTNAGAVASFSLPNLELRWLRAYENLSPEEPRKKTPRTRSRNRGYRIQEVKLTQWKPADPIVHEGKVILAPTDSDVLLCLDINSGEPVWFLPRRAKGRSQAFREVIGHDGERLFLGGAGTLQAVDLASGKRLYETSLEAQPRGNVEGWGTVAGAHVWLPFAGGAYRFRKSDGQLDGVLEFPREELGAADWSKLPQRLQFAGPILLSICESGMTAYANGEDLAKLSEEPFLHARALAATGRIEPAFDALTESLERASSFSEEDRQKLAGFAVRLAGELAEQSKEKDRAAALAFLDRCAASMQSAGLPADPRLILFRIETLDPQESAKEIRRLRGRLADLTLDELSVLGIGSKPGEKR